MLDLVMAEESKIAKLQDRAFLDSLSQSMVYVFHLDHANNPGSGAAVLVSLNDCTYVASALHNFIVEEKSDTDSIVKIWNETNFHVREAPLQFHGPLSVPTNLEARKGAERSLLIDRDRDLIAVRLKPEEILPPDHHPINLKSCAYTGEVEHGAVLTTLGLPLGGAQRSESGPKLVPYRFSATFDPEIPKPSVRSEHKSDDYLLYPYTGNVGAKGYSGAPVWISRSADTELLWRANPLIVGIVLKRLPTSNLILALRIKHLIALLRKDILPDVSVPMRVG
jgi:hypothetical protein